MYSIGIYMDPITEIDFSKDSTVAIIKNLQRKSIMYITNKIQKTKQQKEKIHARI